MVVRLRILTLALIPAFSAGCVLSVYDLPIDYEVSGDVPRIDRADLPTLLVGDIEDNRGASNPRMIMHQKNQYGQTMSGGWQAEKDLSLIVQDALKQGIVASGLDQGGPGQLTLSGELIEVASEHVVEFFSGTTRVKMTVKLQASDTVTGHIVWRDTFISVREAKGGTISNNLRAAFRSALDDLLRRLFSDQYFLQQVQRSHVTTTGDN